MALQDTSTSHKVVWNTIFNAIGRFGSMALSLFLTPYIFNTIGKEAYGLWALLFVVTDFASLFDMGLGSAYMKHIAEFRAKNDLDRVNQVINTGLVFSVAFSLAVVGAGLVFAEPLLAWLHCDLPEGWFALAGVLFIFGVNYSLLVFRAVLNGLLRLDLVHGTQLTTAVIGAGCTVALLESGWGLRGVVVSRGLVTALSSIAFVAFAKRVLPSLRVGFRWVRWEMFKRLFNFGWKIQAAAVSDTANQQVDKLLLGAVLGRPALVGFYDLGNRISGIIRTVGFMLLGAIEAAAAELFASGRREALVDLYARSSRYLIALTAPLCAFVLLFAPWIIHLYLGAPRAATEAGYAKVALAARMLSLAILALLLMGPPKAVARGMGELGPEVGASIWLLVLNVGLSVALVIRYGYAGALTGTTIASSLSFAYYMYAFHRRTGFPFLRLMPGVYARALAACAIAGAAGAAAENWIAGHALPPGRLGCMIVLGAVAAAFFLVYAGAAALVRLVTREDAALVWSAIWRRTVKR